MKVGSCVEMESSGPRLYTHLPTRASGQDRARGPRPSSPIEPPGGAPLLVFSSPPFLDSICLPTYLPTYLPYLSPCLTSFPLSFFSSYTASRISASISLASAYFQLAHRFFCSFPFRPTTSTLDCLICPVLKRSPSSRMNL